MDKLLLYAYGSGISMAVFYGLYWIFFRKETFFRFNRFYLLGTILFSCLVPFVFFKPEADLDIPYAFQLILLASYLLGVMAILGRMFLGIFRVYKLRLGGTRIHSESYSMVFSKQNLAPFSFFSTVFMNESLVNSFQRNFVLSHELSHIRQFHSYDNIIVEICLAFFWFNPFMWFIRKSLRQTHEYLADEGIRKTGLDLAKYQLILIKQGKGISPLSVSNDFKLMTKERIRIMFKDRPSFFAKFKPLLIIPAALFLFLVFIFPDRAHSLLRDQEQAYPGEKRIRIQDQRNSLVECVSINKPAGASNHDVEAKRVRLSDGREAYFMNFYLLKGAEIEAFVFGYLTVEDFDQLLYDWHGDTAIVKFQNSLTRAHMDFQWNPSKTGSTLQRIETPD